ncbi:maternal protein exuperantia [Nomia melanderi]|uniref:maternal protein exuperantia n=1 Tax=Nomia melanderi TaxID=2448451 RepID=UPI0013042F5B|nr:maternal protein exuperantia [Nomia melanderi]XP_031837387.1 maternal protein exuperantia [Nomia melanderi]XP_031837388.1 maternal protein exuperantia [Nomia melanderi]XP_031837389.1 maternal protein exuperantia [Nomia melanderi]XP_031837391.1 maternal protein exuperantia [Nomia melanderi]XP_031837392.1 maternal protein exuperantia [Nomia melanderi]
MVATTVVENVKPSNPRKSCDVGIGPGNYQIVGWDMDTTGKKVIDETCQIAGYTPSSSYSQYVMPFKDLNPPAMKRHNMKVATIGKYRVLKDMKANKILKTKSEVSALTEFITWLESIKGDATDGVILVYHEPRKVIPAMLLESLKKYNLLERFKQTVKGFANGFNVAQAKCTNTVRAYTLRALSRTLFNQEKELDNAKDRACLALQIVQHLSSVECTATETNGSSDSESAIKQTVEFIREFVQPIEAEEQEYEELKIVFERQNTLKPIFGVLFTRNRRERQHASPLRRLLAEAGIEYSELQEAWGNGKKEGLEKLIKEKLTTAEEKKKEDLLIVLESHFDPDKKPRSRVSLDGPEIKTKNSKICDDRENNNKCQSGTESPDTTTFSSPPKLKSELEERAFIPEE